MRTLLVGMICLFVACSDRTANQTPVMARALDLARAYRNDAETAGLAFDHRPIILALTNPVVRGRELHWHLAGPAYPAVVVCHFPDSQPMAGSVLWVRGVCEGIVRDGEQREFRGYDFHVVITGCRIVPPPTRQGP